MYFRQFYNEKIWITWGLLVDEGSGSGFGIFPDPDSVFSRIRIRVTQKDRIRIRNTGKKVEFRLILSAYSYI